MSALAHPIGIPVGDAPASCHLYPQFGNALFSHCGVPREEQSPHCVLGSQTAAVCAACGLPRCPVCLAHHLRDNP